MTRDVTGFMLQPPNHSYVRVSATHKLTDCTT